MSTKSNQHVSLYLISTWLYKKNQSVDKCKQMFPSIPMYVHIYKAWIIVGRSYQRAFLFQRGFNDQSILNTHLTKWCIYLRTFQNSKSMYLHKMWKGVKLFQLPRGIYKNTIFKSHCVVGTTASGQIRINPNCARRSRTTRCMTKIVFRVNGPLGKKFGISAILPYVVVWQNHRNYLWIRRL
jgi:hypothetical protein